jgi:hypothetical protein
MRVAIFIDRAIALLAGLALATTIAVALFA